MARETRWITRAALVFSTLFGAYPSGAVAATDWATGKALGKRLVGPINITWSGNPLRAGLRNLSRVHRVAVIIDRRVDPGEKVDLVLQDVPLGAALTQIAANRKLEARMLGPVAYFGPPRAASRLRTIATLRTEEVRRLPPEVGQKLFGRRPMAWNDLATPRGLLEKLAAEAGLQIAGLDRLPHDLWAAADLPPLTLLQRLTLVLVQFDLTFDVSPDGRTLTLVPVPDDVALVRSYPGGRQPKATAGRYAQLAPDARIKVVGDKVYVRGLLEDHEQLGSSRRPPSGQPPRPAVQDFANKRFTLRVSKQPVGPLLRQLVGQLNLELRIDIEALRRAGISLDQHVSFSVKEVTVDALLEAVVKSTRLELRRRGNLVEVGPAK